MGVTLFDVGKDMEYYRGIFIEAGCPKMLADTLARGHLGMEMLSPLETHIKNSLLQGYPYETALTFAQGKAFSKRLYKVR